MILVFILFVLLVAVILLPSLLAAQKNAIHEVQESLVVRMSQLKKDFQFRTKELARRLQSDDLAEDEWQQLTDELALDTRAAIDSTQSASESDKTNTSWLLSLILMIIVIGLSFVVYQFSGSYDQAKQQIELVDLLQSDSQTIDKLSERVQVEKSQHTLNSLYLALRTKVELIPTNTYSWRSLAMFNADYGRIDEAKEAMDIALDIEPNNLDLKLDLAQILAQSKNKQDLFKSRKLISEVLKTDPKHEDAALLLGLNSYQFGMYQMAIDTWTDLLNRSESDSALARMLNLRIEKAKQMLTGDKPLDHPKTAATSDAKLTIKIEIPAEIKARLKGSEGLFIFAKAVDGPKFPIAVVRTTVAALDSEFVLSDANAMRPEFALSKYEKITVNARISFSGEAVAKSGDIQGTTDIIKAPFPNSIITVVLDQTVK